MKKIMWILINILIKLSILLVFVSFYLWIFEKELLKHWIELLRGFILELWAWNYPIAFISSLIESFPVLGIALPSQNILMAIAGFFWQNSLQNLILIIFLASIWAVLGNFIGYFLWVHHWEKFIDKYGLWIGITKTDVKYLKKSLHKWWAIWIILWKFHPTTRTFLPFIAWMSGMSSMRFAAYNVLWSIIWAATVIIMWVFFAAYYKNIIDYAWTIMLIVTWATAFYIWKFKKKEFLIYWNEKNQEMDERIQKQQLEKEKKQQK
jgi:membrane protein DedA with SNARE-associated domain